MRIVIALAVLISVAAPAHAEDSRAQGPRESRYGPTTPRQAAIAVAAATARYDGPMLGWAGKREILADVAAPTASAPTPPTPVASWAGYQAAPVPPAYTPPPAPTPAPSSPALPTSLYAAPRAAQPMAPQPIATQPQPAAAPRPAVDWSNYRSSRVAPVSSTAAPTPAQTPAPANLYAQPIASQPIARQAAAPAASPAPAPVPAPAQSQPQSRQVAAKTPGATGARFYSVDRAYGMTPDAIPPAGPDSHVLIAAAEPSPEAKDATPMHGSADWLAAGVSGNDGDDESTSRDRRAKTQDQAL